jgi:hypothetical protein
MTGLIYRIMKHLKLFEEFIENSDNIIDIKMTEIRDLIESISDEGHNLIYEWENKDNHELIINFSYDGLSVKYEFSIDDMSVTKIVNEAVDFTEGVESIDEGLDIIEKDIYMILGVSESKRGRPKAGRTKTGRKVPGKYLTKNRKLMKKEIEEFQGKDIYKKDWDADYKSGRGGKGKRHQTKKSAATIAYQKKYSNK